MTDEIARLLEIAGVLGCLSLLSFGGGTAALGEMQREMVDRGWMTSQEFVQAYALGQITPGPGVTFVVPMGYHAGGIAGALIAIAAYFVPASLIALGVARVWAQIRASRWPTAVRTAMLPVATGLTIASAYTMVRSGLGDAVGVLIAVGAFATLTRTSLPTPLVLGAGGALGIVFLQP